MFCSNLTRCQIVLSLSVALQLALFFTLVTTAIWIDKIARGNIRRIAFHSKIYKAAFIVTAIVRLPQRRFEY